MSLSTIGAALIVIAFLIGLAVIVRVLLLKRD